MKLVTDAKARPHLQGRRVDLAWQNPPASDFSAGAPLDRIRIVRRERTYPLDGADGDLIYDGPVRSAFSDRGLEPLTPYYYTIFTVDTAAVEYAGDSSNVEAFAGENFGLAERLYRMLPALHQRYDTPLRADELALLSAQVLAALANLPKGLQDRGQLYRFFHGAAPLDLMRSFADGLRQLRDIDVARSAFLLPLAQWIGWELDRTLPVFARRNEIKFAPRLYRTTGTVPNLRAIVNRYTGWNAQVAELVHNIARSNNPPQMNVFAKVADGATWRGADDAAPLLGFGAANSSASGAPGLPAILTSTLSEPFALRPGVELAVTADDRIPVAVRLRPGDFADISAATAAEVVAALNRTLSEITATRLGTGQIELRSHTRGPDSAIRVEQYAASLVTLEGAPSGRLSSLTENTLGIGPRVRLFYEAADPQTRLASRAAAQALSGPPFPTGPAPGAPTFPLLTGPAPGMPPPSYVPQRVPPEPLFAGPLGAPATVLPSEPLGRVRYKTFRRGVWSESYPLTPLPAGAEGDPAALLLPDGRIFVAWIDRPDTAEAKLRWTTGTVRSPRPARLQGQRTQFFAIPPGSRLLFRGAWPDPEGFEFAATDMANPLQVTAAEVALALNARLDRVTASVVNFTIRIETIEPGGDQRLEIDLHQSSAAPLLGFGEDNASAVGDSGDEIDWNPPQDVPSAGPGRHSDLSAIVDGAGDVRLFWSMHGPRGWTVVSARWNGAVWTAAPELLAEGPGGNREPCAALDLANRIWLFWARREGVATSDDTWTLRRRVFDPGTLTWSAEAALTTPPIGGRATDREPGVVRIPGGDLRIFFRSDRAGGPDLWSLTVTPATAVQTAIAAVTNDYAADAAPAPLFMPGGALALLYRSDRSVALSRVGTRPPRDFDNRVTSPPRTELVASRPLASVRAPDTGSVARFAGSTSAPVRDQARVTRRRQFDDLLCYTPQHTLGVPRELPLKDDDLYTRGTVGLYLSQIVPNSPISQQRIQRLRPVLDRFLPINVRAVVILAPRVDIEFVFPPGDDMEELVFDKHPDIEHLAGLDDPFAMADAPSWVQLLANTAGHVSVDPGNPLTLRRRTFIPRPFP